MHYTYLEPNNWFRKKNPSAYMHLRPSINPFYIIREHWICMNTIAMEEFAK